MMGVNLIPAELLAAHQRARRIRLWSGIVATIGAVSAVPTVWQMNQRAQATRLSETKSALILETATVRAELERVTGELADLNERIERAATLSTKRSWAGLLTLITRAMPEEIWLSSIVTKTQTPGPAPTPAPTKDPNQPPEPSVVVMDGATRLDLQGFAIDHERLYDFMSRLKTSQVFARVDLIKATKEPVLWSEAVRFELTCTW